MGDKAVASRHPGRQRTQSYNEMSDSDCADQGVGESCCENLCVCQDALRDTTDIDLACDAGSQASTGEARM